MFIQKGRRERTKICPCEIKGFNGLIWVCANTFPQPNEHRDKT